MAAFFKENVDKFVVQFHYLMAQLDKELSKYPTLNRLEAQLGGVVSKAHATVGILSIFSLFVFFNIAAGFLTNLLGWGIPAYLSMKALETPGHDDDTQWLTYWVIFGGFNFLESMSGLLVSWFPYYYTFKTCFILYLILPQTRGATVVYAKVFKPLAAAQPHKAAPAPAATTESTSQ
jgi:receptor expression-enhancing protein 5/6